VSFQGWFSPIGCIDTSSATKALVSFIESYVSFRLSSPGRSPLVDGGGIVDRYAPVTFAVDFTFFKKVLGTILEVSRIEESTNQISLQELKLLPIQPALRMGWRSELEGEDFEVLCKFIRN
jgi:hypothetical protein